ncbi:hypothetical protein HAX54_045186 [Datura stramonium]|uniref:Uncharacterized protein n=1 Tax=Datura stramonium TaxID=4076 RepID=A0ABS8WFK6_DATST|nr:hypothetical protein [Datura stramonium]
MGKNTMMKRTIRVHAEKTGNETILNLIPLLVGNVGLIFTKGDWGRSEQGSYQPGWSTARVGLVAPVDVYLFLMETLALRLPELRIRPFSYGLVVLSVYDNGSIFSPEVLNLTEDDLVGCHGSIYGYLLVIGHLLPNFGCFAPHMFTNAYKNLLYCS